MKNILKFLGILLVCVMCIFLIRQCNDQSSQIDTKKVTAENSKKIPYFEMRKYIDGISGTIEEPNSVGGVNLKLEFTNTNSKTIKYIHFTVTPYNAVDDIVSSKIGGISKTKLKYTGPIKPNEKSSVVGKCIWYNSDTRYAILSQIDIEYIDGEQICIDAGNLRLQ